MKALFTLLIAMMCIRASAQDSTKYQFNLKDGYLVYGGVVSLDSTYSENALNKATKTWFVNTFRSPKAVIQSEDQANGRFLGKASIEVPASIFVYNSIAPDVNFLIQIDIKKGKYRYKFYNFTYSFYDLGNRLNEHAFEEGYNLYLDDKTKKGITMSRAGLNKRIVEAYVSLDNQMNGLVNSLKSALKNSKSDEF